LINVNENQKNSLQVTKPYLKQDYMNKQVKSYQLQYNSTQESCR